MIKPVIRACVGGDYRLGVGPFAKEEDNSSR